MTVSDLIENLKQFDPALPVIVEGYETGWDGILTLRIANVMKHLNAHEWDGEFKELGDNQKIGCAALLIVGRRGQYR
ncbi:hypothetical protein ACO0LB_19165 [Undibacterium sp. SXout7W]|uniref:hypothetical protein n=1 Tax=Undibacterium sp. SXout7W TaxID=3413049 RepID=UPI003BF19727